MLRKRVILVFITLGFLITPQTGLSYTHLTGTWKIVAALTDNYTQLRRVEEELWEARSYHETSWSSEETTENRIKSMRAIIVLCNLRYLLLEIRSEINAVKIYLTGYAMVKNEEIEFFYHITKSQIELSIQALDIRKNIIAEQRPFVTSNAAVHSLDKANDIINTVLNILRPLENTFRQLSR